MTRARPPVSRALAARLASKAPGLEDLVARAIARRDWTQLAFLAPRAERWSIFRALKPCLFDDEYWGLLRDVYVDSETLWQQRDLRRLFRARRPQRAAMMTDQERERLIALPPVVHVYRGCQPLNREGWSWTLSTERARFFARLCGFRHLMSTGIVRYGTVDREHVVALLDARTEEEVVVDPNDVRVVREERVAVDEGVC